LRKFVEGDFHALIAFAERYDKTASSGRYILVNELGDGRSLSGTPSVVKDVNGGYTIRCPVLPSVDRILAADIPRSWALSDNHDLMVRNGNWAMVAGLEALPQQVKTCLSHQRGESPVHHDFGTQFAEYYNLLSGSLWFDRFLKLEIIRQAAIPYTDPTNGQQYTPLLCVERVFGIELLAAEPTDRWLPIRVDLSVKGVGRWQHDISVCIPPHPTRRPSFDELLAGPSHGTSY
jgi:hypothetical protein